MAGNLKQFGLEVLVAGSILFAASRWVPEIAQATIDQNFSWSEYGWLRYPVKWSIELAIDYGLAAALVGLYKGVKKIK